MNKRIFYNKITAISFIIIALLGILFIPSALQAGLEGRYDGGFPLVFYTSVSTSPDFPTTYNFPNLILNILIYYALAISISLISQHFIKKK